MNVRKSCLSDLEEILQIYVHARAWMKKNGNPTQWGDDWPERWAVQRDIEAGNRFGMIEWGVGELWIIF